MRKFPVVAILALSFCFSPSFAAKHAFQTGKLIDVTTDERLAEGTSYRRAIFVVQIADIVYTLRGGRVSVRAKDYAQGLIVGDPVQVSIEDENVILLRPNGKELKASILKRERVQSK
jgi:hypothetical protein